MCLDELAGPRGPAGGKRETAAFRSEALCPEVCVRCVSRALPALGGGHACLWWPVVSRGLLRPSSGLSGRASRQSRPGVSVSGVGRGLHATTRRHHAASIVRRAALPGLVCRAVLTRTGSSLELSLSLAASRCCKCGIVMPSRWTALSAASAAFAGGITLSDPGSHGHKMATISPSCSTCVCFYVKGHCRQSVPRCSLCCRRYAIIPG